MLGKCARVVDAQGLHLDKSEIVEHRDADESQLAITLINSGIFAFDREVLFKLLDELRPDNSQGEYYLTDVPKLLAARGDRVGMVVAESPDEVLGINTVQQLAEAEAILAQRGCFRMDHAPRGSGPHVLIAGSHKTHRHGIAVEDLPFWNYELLITNHEESIGFPIRDSNS